MNTPSKLLKLALVVIPLSTLTACSSSDDDDDGGSSSTQTEQTLESGTTTSDDTTIQTSDENEASNDSETITSSSGQFDGDYATVCEQDRDSDDMIVGSSQEAWSIMGDIAVNTLTIYSDADCIQTSATSINTFSLIFQDGTTTTALGTANHILLTLTGLVSNGFDFGDILEQRETDQLEAPQIILLDGINLHFGQSVFTNGSSTPEIRPTEINTTPYVRQ